MAKRSLDLCELPWQLAGFIPNDWRGRAVDEFVRVGREPSLGLLRASSRRLARGRCRGQTLEIVFTEPPRWLGQLGFTSGMTEWKTRFNYTWDWTSRLVQLGVTGSIALVAADGRGLGSAR